MLKQIVPGIWVHESVFLQSNAMVVQGTSGVLLIDPGITNDEMDDLARDLQVLGQNVVAGFSTHPHWDHLLWHAKFGDVPRYATAPAAEKIQNFLANPEWKSLVAPLLPPDYANQIPIDDLFGKITALPAETKQIPWDGPKVRVIEHSGHAAGSAALLIEERGVLVAGDMLSDILMPFIELGVADPIQDYLAALQLFEGVADDVKVFVPGHGSVGDRAQLRARIEQDRAYVHDLHDGGGADDPRLTTGPKKDLLAGVHEWQVQQIAQKNKT